MQPLYVLTEDDWTLLTKLIERVSNGRPGPAAGPFSPPPVAAWRPTGFWAKITGSASLATNRWKYAWTEQERTTSGFQDLSGGRSGTTSTGYAVNACEANNDGTGTQGNSVNIDGADFPAGFSMQPVEGDPVVWIRYDLDSSGDAAYTFEYVNAVDGTCEAEE